MIKYDKTYDSHVHFFGVGLGAVEWIIKDNNLLLPDHLKRTDFIRGFGLKNSTTDEEIKILAKNYPKTNFCISYEDGHSSLVSKRLIEKYSFSAKHTFKDHGEFLSLFEIDRDNFLKLLPKRSFNELTLMARHSLNYFKERGVLRVRHMTCTKDQWQVLSDIYNSINKPDLKIECLFAEFMQQTLNEALEAYNFAVKNPIEGVSPQGIKLFVDGSIGRRTAYMSAYKKAEPRLNKEQLSKRMKSIMVDQKNSLALHVIGDLALEMSLEVYHSLTAEYGDLKTLHLEHAPIFTLKSLDLLSKQKLNCSFHFQPSHWLTDSKWYQEEKELLNTHKIYPFEDLDKMKYSYFIGSDAPIEESNNNLTDMGLELIKKTR
jgi:predicted amidohydrolase YtcJ